MEIQEIYKAICQRIWSFFPTEASSISFYAHIYENHYGYSVDFIVNDKMTWFEDNEPSDIYMEIINLLKELNQHMLFDQKWTQCIVTLYDDGEFKINFAYVPDEDSWSGLYLKGISDLTEQEAYDIYSIPVKIWQDCINRRDEIYDERKD